MTVGSGSGVGVGVGGTKVHHQGYLTVLEEQDVLVHLPPPPHPHTTSSVETAATATSSTIAPDAFNLDNNDLQFCSYSAPGRFSPDSLLSLNENTEEEDEEDNNEDNNEEEADKEQQPAAVVEAPTNQPLIDEAVVFIHDLTSPLHDASQLVPGPLHAYHQDERIREMALRRNTQWARPYMSVGAATNTTRTASTATNVGVGDAIVAPLPSQRRLGGGGGGGGTAAIHSSSTTTTTTASPSPPVVTHRPLAGPRTAFFRPSLHFGAGDSRPADDTKGFTTTPSSASSSASSSSSSSSSLTLSETLLQRGGIITMSALSNKPSVGLYAGARPRINPMHAAAVMRAAGPSLTSKEPDRRLQLLARQKMEE